MAGQRELPVEVRHLDVVEVVQAGVLAGTGEHHDGHALGDDLELGRRHRPGQDGYPVRPAGDLGDRALRIVGDGGGDEESVALLSGRTLHAADHLVGVEHEISLVVLGVVAELVALVVATVMLVVVRKTEPEDAGGSTGQAARVATRHVAEGPGRLQDALACPGPDCVGVPIDPGHGGDGDARLVGDVVHRGSAHWTTFA